MTDYYDYEYAVSYSKDLCEDRLWAGLLHFTVVITSSLSLENK
jgi:hypothetical protein